MATFKRPNMETREITLSSEFLPRKGSDHPGFLEMGFSWLSPNQDDPRYRGVRMPKNMGLAETDDPEKFLIRDALGFPRAEIRVPSDRKTLPGITPVRRFSAHAERTSKGWRAVILQWNKPYVRGGTHMLEADALKEAVRWLDDNKAGWTSYISGVNFAGKPPR